MYGMVRFRIRNPPIGFVARREEGVGSLLPVHFVKHILSNTSIIFIGAIFIDDASTM